MKNIFISTTTFAQFSSAPLKLLKERKFDLILNDKNRKLSEDEIVKSVSKINGILAGTEIYSKNVLDKALKLKVISRLGVGLDNIDLNYAKMKGIKVFTTQTTPAPAVAELTLGLMLDVARGISQQNQNLKSGIWQKDMGNLLQGKTLGIIGLGTIGKNLVQLVKGFRLKILAFDSYHDKNFSMENNIKYCDLDTLLSKSDIVTIHLNLSDKTNQLLNLSKIGKMKTGSILINTSRGEIIDENALITALKENKILGAGLDVYNQEPYIGPLIEFKNVVLTPHVGSYAKELRIQMEIEAVANLIKGLNE